REDAVDGVDDAGDAALGGDLVRPVLAVVDEPAGFGDDPEHGLGGGGDVDAEDDLVGDVAGDVGGGGVGHDCTPGVRPWPGAATGPPDPMHHPAPVAGPGSADGPRGGAPAPMPGPGRRPARERSAQDFVTAAASR